MNIRHVITYLFVSFFWCNAAAENRQLVLVTTTNNTQLSALSQKEIKKLYLGIPVNKSGNLIVPFRNQTDPLIYEVFLQKVIFMSSRNYERQIVMRSLRTGRKRPLAVTDKTEIIKRIQSSPGAVTFMWISDVNQHPDIRTVQSLWDGSVD